MRFFSTGSFFGPKRGNRRPINLNTKGKRPKNTNKPKNTTPLESEEQAIVVNYLNNEHPGLVFFAIPNGGSRYILEAINLKKTGVKRGAPDLFIAKAKNGFHGLFIEMKRVGRGRISKNQEIVLSLLSEEGYLCKVCFGHNAAIKVIKEYLG